MVLECVQGLIRTVHLVDQLSQDELEEEDGVVVVEEVALAVDVVAEVGEDGCLLADLEILIMITCSHPTVITLVEGTNRNVI